MRKSNNRPVTFGPLMATLCLAIFIAWLGSFIPESNALGLNLKSYSLFSEIQPKRESKGTRHVRKTKKQATSLGLSDTSSSLIDTTTGIGLAKIILPEYPVGPIPIEDFGDSIPNFQYLKSALDSLQTNPENRKVRIGYFGDSAIEGDLVTQDLRRFFQKTYGGNGVGWVPITSPVAAFRSTIKHQFSDNWSSYTWMSPKKVSASMGWGGTLELPSSNETSWVRFSQKGAPAPANLYLRNRYFQHQLEIGDTQIQVDSSSRLQSLSLGASKSYFIQWPAGARDEVYGVSFESNRGVILDNLSLRGNSGLPLSQLSVNLTKQFSRHLPYQCLVLQYGLNVASPELTSLYWYEVGLRRAVRHLKKLFPNTTILMIGVGDKSARIEGEYKTDPSIPHILSIQRKIAMEEKICFWSLFHAMGGENAALDWIAQNPPLLAKDYTHLSPAGARKVAGLIEQALKSTLKSNITMP